MCHKNIYEATYSGESVTEILRTIIILCPNDLMTFSKLVEYIHYQKSRKSIILNVELMKQFPSYIITRTVRNGTQSKVSSPKLFQPLMGQFT